MCDCFKIGGPWIAEDPDCPVHGTERVKEDTRQEEHIQQLEEMQRKLLQALELIAVGDVIAPIPFCRDTLVELGFWNIKDLHITDPDANGYRPPCCDGGKLGSKCCDLGFCVADAELKEMGLLK